MELNVLERIVLQDLLPKENDYITFRIIKELRTELSFTEHEIKEYSFKQENEKLTWNVTKEKLKVFDIGDKVKSIIIEALQRLDKEGKINDNNVSLYEKFITT